MKKKKPKNSQLLITPKPQSLLSRKPGVSKLPEVTLAKTNTSAESTLVGGDQ